MEKTKFARIQEIDVDGIKAKMESGELITLSFEDFAYDPEPGDFIEIVEEDGHCIVALAFDYGISTLEELERQLLEREKKDGP